MARFSSLVATVALALSSVTTATPLPVATSTEYDVLIVGGGPAGLSALSGLARVRRNVLMLDSGEYRNAATRHMHDVIGNDGAVPAVFRALAREQISRYPTASMKNATVSSITGGNGSVFTATDSNGEVYTAKKIVLATGMKDILPGTPGIEEAWGNGLFWCPWCDGYEHRDQEFGIIGSLKSVLSTVQEVDTLNKDIIAFVNGTYTDDVVAALNNSTEPLWREKIEAYGVQIENRTISSIGRTQDGAVVKSADGTSELDRFIVTFEDGETVKRSAFISNFPTAQRSCLGADLGIPVVDEKLVVNTKSMQSDVAGVYVIGDANNDGSTNVPHAMFSGKRAAVFVHVQLERENSNEMIANLKRSDNEWDAEAEQLMGRDLENLWSEIDGAAHA